MASTAIETPPATTRTERYLEAERSLWQHYGLEPHERFIELDAPKLTARIHPDNLASQKVAGGINMAFEFNTVAQPGVAVAIYRALPPALGEMGAAAGIG